LDGGIQQQIPFGDDNKKNKDWTQRQQRQRQQQIPFGDDDKKSKEAPLLIESGAS
jgi:hypothetical protein